MWAPLHLSSSAVTHGRGPDLRWTRAACSRMRCLWISVGVDRHLLTANTRARMTTRSALTMMEAAEDACGLCTSLTT